MYLNRNLLLLGFFSDFFTLRVDLKHSNTFLELSTCYQFHCGEYHLAFTTHLQKINYTFDCYMNCNLKEMH